MFVSPQLDIFLLRFSVFFKKKKKLQVTSYYNIMTTFVIQEVQWIKKCCTLTANISMDCKNKICQNINNDFHTNILKVKCISRGESEKDLSASLLILI